MKQFVDASTRQRRFFGQYLQVVLAVLLLSVVQNALGQTNFSSAMVIYGDSGAVTVDNTGVVPDQDAPTIAGVAPNYTVWFQWTTTNSGEVTFDTMGSVDGFWGGNMDTVMGVYTGSDLATLGLVTANDNLYSYPQYNYAAQNYYPFADTNYLASTNAPLAAQYTYSYMQQPFAGPSQIRFNAVAGQTYYIAVDTKSLPGNVSLNWSLHPSGVFRFATEESDNYSWGATYADGMTPMLLYTCAATEGSFSTRSGNPDRYSLINPLGVLVTVTRVGGANGRVTVDYTASVIDTNSPLLNTNGFLVNGDLPAQSSVVVTPYYTNPISGIIYYTTNSYSRGDFTPVSGTLTFDDYEMSKKILIPISSLGGSSGAFKPNCDFLVTLTNAQVDASELDADASASISPLSPPRVDNMFSQALVRILNVNVDPKYSYSDQVSNAVTGNMDTIYRLNNPTNPVFNFQRSHYNVYRAGAGHSFTVFVERSPAGTNSTAHTIYYKVNSEYPYTKNGLQENGDNEFPLQPGSDYATPSPVTVYNIKGKSTDFVFDNGYSGSVSWGDNDSQPKGIDFQIYDNGLEQFNKDFKISLYDLDSHGNPFQVGMVSDTYVTILNARELDNSTGANELYLPAGAVDELYNPDFSSQFWLNQDNRAHPGASGEILGVALQADGNAVMVGNFTTYNGVGVGCIARVDTNGYLDQTFNTSDAVNTTDGSYVSCVITNALGQILIGGNFTSYSGGYCRYIALLNTDGSLDSTFTQNVGDGFDGPVSSLVLQPDGKILVGGDFASFNGVTRNFVARLNADGTLDTTFDATTNLNTAVNALALQANGQVVVGGQFTNLCGVAGQSYVGRLNADGSIDPAFDPGAGADAPVNAVAIQPDGKIVVGGDFYQMNGKVLSHIARLYTNGLLDTAFGCVYGTDGSVYNLNIQTNPVYSTEDPTLVLQANFTIYVGGRFTTVNGTHRLGFARLNADGALDTSFMDTAYNQFAGLPRLCYGDPVRSVLASAIQSDGNILIAGSFDQVGGGEFNINVRSNSFVGAYYGPSSGNGQPFVRSAIRNHSNFARIIGGGTPGPGNISMALNSYSVNKSAGSLFVSLLRTNGSLGNSSANFRVIPGQAQPGVDYFYNGNYNGTMPLYISDWSASRTHGAGIWGGSLVPTDDWADAFSAVKNAWINLTVTGNTNSYANLGAQLQLSNPLDRDQFYLGGEDIPLGVALGAGSSAPLTLVEDRHQSGTVSFSQSTYVSAGPTAPITVVRTNGTYGIVYVSYLTTTNGTTAVAGQDYRLVGTSNTVSIANGASTASFSISIISSNYSSSVEKTVGLLLSGISAPYDGVAHLGATNAILRIINPNFQGFLGLTATNYGAKLSDGSVSFTVARTVGDKGLLTVQYATVDGTATNGVDYVGKTNTLTWNNGDYTNKVVTISLLNSGGVGANRQFGLRLFNPQNYGTNVPALFAADSITNATVTLTNDNSYGSFQFSSPAYVVSENGGTSTITVIRTGATNGTATVQCATANGPAVSGVNYNGVTNTLTFVPGQMAASFNVTIKDDGVSDPAIANFYFTASLSNPSAGASLGSVTTTTNYIVESNYNRPAGDNDTSFNSGTGMDADVLALGLQSTGKIIAGGNFTAVGGVPESHLARLNANGTLDYTGFLYGLAGVNSSVNAIKIQADDKLLIGGAFTTLNGLVRNRISRLLTDGTIDSSFNPGAGANSTVYALDETFVAGARKIYVVGAFTTMQGISRPRVARLNDNGSIDTAFSTGTGPNGIVYGVAVYPTNSVLAGKAIIGGAFTNISGLGVSRLARLNANGSVDTNFAPGLSIDSPVRTVALQVDGKILLGGDFTNVNGSTMLHLARLNVDGSLDTSFVGSIGTLTNGSVSTIVVQADNRILVGGQFAQANGLNRNNITRLYANGLADPTINFGSAANGAVNTIVVQPADQMLVLGGAFTTFNDQTASHIVRVYGGSETGSGSFRFTSTSYRVNENGSQALIGIRRTGGSSGPNVDGTGDITISFFTQPGSMNPAVAGVNYSNVSQVLTFPAGEVLRYVAVPVMQDFNITADLTVALTLTNPASPAQLGDQYLAQLTIVNVDSGISFANSSYLVDKKILTGVASLQIVRAGTIVGTSSVDYMTTTNGTAVIGTDYYPTNGTVIFGPGETNKTIQVQVINNGLVEGNRTVSLILSNAVGAPLMAPTNTVLTIQDTTQAAGYVRFASTLYNANSGDGHVTLSLTRTNGTSGTITVSYATVAGTAQPGVDYAGTTSQVSMNEGISDATIDISLLNNGTAKAISSFSVLLLSVVGTNGALMDPTNATVFISNTNSGVGFVSATNTVAEDAGSALIYVQRYGATNGTTAVNYGFTNVTAVSGVNYQGVNGTLTFFPGEVQKPISVPLVHNSAVTGDLLFNIGLAQPQSGTALVSPMTTTVVEQDAEAGFSFTNSTMTVSKNAGVAIITVVCSNPRVEPVIQSSNTIPLEVSYATADGTAVAGSEYAAVSGTLVFTNGIGTNTFTVPIYNNGLVTGDRNFTVSLSNPTAPGQLITPSTQTVVIAEYNSGVAFSKANYTAFKNGVSTTIDVYRTGYTDRVVTVNFLATNGTAVNGVNFVSTNGTLQFTNGVTKQSFNVPLIASTKVQPNLTVQLQLSNPGSALLASPNAATLTLLENSGSYVVPAGAQVVTNYTTRASDGIIRSGDTVQVLFALRVSAGLQTTNLVAYLLPTNGVSAVTPSSQTYGPLIPYSHSVSKAFTFTVTGTNNLTMAPTFALYDNGQYLGSAAFGFTLGTWTNVFANSNQIVINANGAASPYPAVIMVSGPGSTLVNATVTLTNVNQSVGRDVSALVVSPTGKSTLIMSGAGGVNRITRATLTFDDSAPSSLSQSGQIITGTNKPTAYTTPARFP